MMSAWDASSAWSYEYNAYQLSPSPSSLARMDSELTWRRCGASHSRPDGQEGHVADERILAVAVVRRVVCLCMCVCERSPVVVELPPIAIPAFTASASLSASPQTHGGRVQQRRVGLRRDGDAKNATYRHLCSKCLALQLLLRCAVRFGERARERERGGRGGPWWTASRLQSRGR